ncbi:MAG: winged helix-turn-helix transcriptional regulator [Thermoplasmata archaeon]|nr:winged helix-turn-helix transcriptional regulator [Thermoplasmata archaeon]
MSSGDKVLENKIRRMIYNLIVIYPGVSFNNILKIFELTDSNLRYHLNYLEKNDKIRSGLEGGMRYYYPHPSTVKLIGKPQNIIESYKLTQEQERVLGIIKENPGINQSDLIKKSGINHTTALRNLNTLRNLNLIQNRKLQNNVYYEYVPDVEMKYAIIKGLVIKFLRKEIDEETFLRLKRKLE